MTDEHRARYEGWRVVLASSAGVFLGFGSLVVYTFGIFLKPLAEEFGWSREGISAAFGFAAVMVAIASPPLGQLLDRYRPHRVILPALTIYGCAFASLAFLTPPLWHLYAVFIVLGIVGNGTAQMAYARTISNWFTQRRGLAFAMLMTGSAIGAMVWPPVSQRLVLMLGWRSAALTLGLGALLIGVPIVAIFVRERPGTSANRETVAPGASVREGLGTRVFWMLVAVLFVNSIAQNGAITHLSALLTDRGVSASGGAMALSAMGGAALLGRLATGSLLDRFFAGRVFFVLLTISALGTLLLAGAHSLTTGALAAALIGVGMGGEADVTPYLLSRYFGLRSFSTLYGLTWTAYAIAGAIGPVIMGKAFDATHSYETLLTALALSAFAAAVLMLLLPPYERSRSPPRKLEERSPIGS